MSRRNLPTIDMPAVEAYVRSHPFAAVAGPFAHAGPRGNGPATHADVLRALAELGQAQSGFVAGVNRSFQAQSGEIAALQQLVEL